MIRTFRALASLVLSVALAGCMVETKSPLSSPSPATFDERLIGLWAAEGENERAEIRFTPNKALPGTMNVVYSEIKKNEKKPPATLRFRAWRASVGGRDYLTVVPTDNKTKQSARQFVVFYELKGEEFRFSLMREKPVVDAIKSGAIEGSFVEQPHLGKVVILASADRLAEFIARNHAELFGNATTLKRSNPR